MGKARPLTRVTVRDQNRGELLAAFAAAPPAVKLMDIVRELGIKPATFYGWRYDDPEFDAEVERIKEIRREVVVDHIMPALEDMSRALIDKALEKDVPALRLAFEIAGVVKPVTQNVKVTTNVTASSQAAEDPEKLLAEHDALRDLVARRLERLQAAGEGAGDPGPETLGPGP